MWMNGRSKWGRAHRLEMRSIRNALITRIALTLPHQPKVKPRIRMDPMFLDERQVHQFFFWRHKPKVMRGPQRTTHRITFNTLEGANSLINGPDGWHKREFTNASSGKKHYTEIFVSKLHPFRIWWFETKVKTGAPKAHKHGTLVMSFGHRGTNQVVDESRARELDQEAAEEQADIENFLDEMGV